MARPGSVIGWKLDRSEREDLLRRFPAKYADTIADHVTLETDAHDKPLPDPVKASIVGNADDEDSLECLVVSVDGTTDRPDGSTFHVTWSLDKSKGRRARESNDLLKERGWSAFDQAIPISVEPARF